MTRLVATLLAAGALLLGAGGCGGGDDTPVTATGATTDTAEATLPPPATTAEPRQPRPPRHRRTPRSLADCVGAAPRVRDVLVKGRDSEDVTFFADLAGGRVDVVAVTVAGEGAELTVALFESAAGAARAAPGAAGGGVEAERRGSALVLAPPGADTAAIEDCLRETGYARE